MEQPLQTSQRESVGFECVKLRKKLNPLALAPRVTHPSSEGFLRKLYSPPTFFLKGPFLLRRLAQNAPGII